MTPSPTFLDLFAGAGGLSLGLKTAGWRSLLAVDNWSDAVQTYRHNFPNDPVMHGSVDLLAEGQIGDLLPTSPDWVVGGPPCQGFSTVGKRHRNDPRNRLVSAFVDVVKRLQPQGVLMENVLGLKDMRFVEFLCDSFLEAGYKVTPVVLSAADYGVPQLRRRIFFVGRKDGARFVPPKPVLSEKNYVTVWDAISDLPPLGPGEQSNLYVAKPQSEYQKRLRRGSKTIQGHQVSAHPQHLVAAISHIPDGGNRTYIPDHLQPKSGFHNSYSRLHSRSPAVAVTQNLGKPSGTRCIHPFQHRGLTAREGARLQGFPDTFHFLGGVTSQRLQIANAVSPILAKFLGEALLDDNNWTLGEDDQQDWQKTVVSAEMEVEE